MTANQTITLPAHRAVDRALQVISYLGGHASGASVQEISRAMGVPKPSIHRILTSMRERGFVSQPKAGGSYFLGPAALEAAFRFHADLDVHRLLEPLMDGIRDTLGQTVHLASLDGGEVVYVDKREANIGVRITSVIGGRNPAYATGVGKALLAELLPDSKAVDAWVARYGPLFPRTPHTVATAARLAKSLAETRQRGYAVDDEESEPGLACVAAIVPLVFGRIASPLAISVTGLRSHVLADGLGKRLVALIAEFEFAPANDPGRGRR